VGGLEDFQGGVMVARRAGAATSWRRRAVGAARRRGWEIRHFDPFLRLEDYLHNVLFPFLEIDCVLDVGAHTGEYALALRDAGYRGDIVSFEPVDRSFELLVCRAEADPRWRVCNVALGEADETLEINVTETTTFSSLRRPRHDVVSEFAKGNVVARREPITVRRLDGLFDQVTAGLDAAHPFLKMDTQGWDLHVIAGASGVLDRIAGLQSELSILPIYDGMPDFTVALSTYAELNFDVSAMFPVSRDRYLRLVEFDCVLTRSPAARGTVAEGAGKDAHHS
jgi:FkbM family methyltransferase